MYIFKHSLFRLKITVDCLTSTYPSIHVEDTFKITVGCLWSTYPSIHFSLDEDTLEITVGCPPCTYPSIRNKNLHTCGLWARPPVLSPVPVPAVVRLKTKEGTFYYRNISDEEFIFYYGFK